MPIVRTPSRTIPNKLIQRYCRPTEYVRIGFLFTFAVRKSLIVFLLIPVLQASHRDASLKYQFSFHKLRQLIGSFYSICNLTFYNTFSIRYYTYRLL